MAVLVTIVTAVRNAAGTLERAIQSVFAQTYPEIEYIVIDGRSTDGTQDVIRRHADRLAYWVSEPDRGISDAFNKGVRAARGRLIGLLNADDWMEPDQIERAVEALERTGADFAFGDLVYHDAEGRIRHRIRGDAHYATTLARGMPDVNHPTLVARRAVYERIGGFDPDLRFAMDYDWLLRAHRSGFRGAYCAELVGHMTLKGASDLGWRDALAEERVVSVRHGYPAGRARAVHTYRLAKGGARRLLELVGPMWLHDALRRRFNRSFEPQT